MKSLLADVESFYLHDGREISNALLLYEALHTIEDSHFTHHVSDERNDFANWLGDIHKQKKLARELRKTKSIPDTMQILHKHLLKELSGQSLASQERIHKSAKQGGIQANGDFIAMHALKQNLPLSGSGAFAVPGIPDPRKSPFAEQPHIPVPDILRNALLKASEKVNATIKDFVFSEEKVDETIEDIKRFHD